MIGKNLQRYMQDEARRDPSLPARLRRMKVYFDIAFQLTSMRKKRGLTQAGLAKKMGTTQPNIARWETPGYERYSLSSLLDLAEALNTSLDIRFVERATFEFKESWNQSDKDWPSEADWRAAITADSLSGTKRIAIP